MLGTPSIAFFAMDGAPRKENEMRDWDKITAIALLGLIKDLATAQHAGERAEIAKRIDGFIVALQGSPEPESEAAAATDK